MRTRAGRGGRAKFSALWRTFCWSDSNTMAFSFSTFLMALTSENGIFTSSDSFLAKHTRSAETKRRPAAPFSFQEQEKSVPERKMSLGPAEPMLLRTIYERFVDV